MVRMAQETTEQGEDVTADSTGWWRLHIGQQKIVMKIQRTGDYGGDAT